MYKKLLGTLACALVLAVSACGGGDQAGSGNTGSNAEKKGTVGISMPTRSSERWVLDGDNMKKEFEALGYKVDLQYAEDVVESQVSQLENMLTKGVKILVIAAIDNKSLTDVLKQAKSSNVKVIAYDRLIRETGDVDYYATFDNFKVGVLQANYIVEKLGLNTGKPGPFNIELFAGSLDDNNAFFFFDGAMSVLKPFIDKGSLVVKSGQTDIKQAATQKWDGAVAQARMDNLLSKSYSGAKVDAVLSPYDGISIGIISSLKAVGYGTPAKPLPVITGQDAEKASVKSMIAGEQTQTVYKDTRELAKIATKMADDVLAGRTPQTNNTDTYDNGVKKVPAYLLEPVSVDKENYKKVLIDSGYYKESDLA